MQVHNARRLAKQLHKEGFKTMDQLVTADFAHMGNCLGIGPGDVQKLTQGLHHYQNGTFDESYALPLDSIVQVRENPTRIDRGVQERPAVEDASSQVETAQPGA